MGQIRHGEQGRERKKGGLANLTSAGGGERLNNKYPPPSPIGGRLKNCQTKSPPPLHTDANSKIVKLKIIFLGKYLDDFWSKNMLRISMT
jgi:hypothetical protein